MRFFCKRYFDTLFTVGLILSALVSFNRQHHFLPDFLSGAFTGLGLVFIILPGTLRHSKKFLREMEVARKDERISQITAKSSETALYAVLVAGAVGALAAGSFGESGILIAKAFVIMIAIGVISFAVARLYYSRKI